MIVNKISNYIIKQTCPYCFEQFKFNEAPFRCSNLSCSGQEVDTVLRKNWSKLAGGGKQGKVIDPSSSRRGKAKCSDCNRPTEDRICPSCHAPLPSTYGKCKNAIIAIIGAKNSGKSHYIATLVQELRDNVGPTMNITLSPVNDYTINRYNKEFKEPLYHGKVALDVSKSARTTEDMRSPMLFNLQFSGKDLFGRRAIKKTITLVFFDTAGEDLNSEANMATVNRYIYRSAGIILLLDPRQLSYVRSKLSVDKSEQIVNTRDILSRTASLIRKGRNLNANAMINTPVAVAFSKFDELAPLVDSSFAVMASRSGSATYDPNEAAAISDEIESLLESWQQKGLCHELRSWFQTVGFFGVSALGCKKNPDNTLPHIPRPKRVEDPFLWLLYKLKFLQSRVNGG